MNLNELSKQNDRELIKSLVSLSEVTETFGITITKKMAMALIKNRKDYLMENERYEFGTPITLKLISLFCDSSYIDNDNFVETIDGLQYMFYHYKNELGSALSDDELLEFMRKHFDETCFGSINYLEETVLDNLLRETRGFDV